MLRKFPGVKKTRWMEGMEATRTATSMAQRGGFMKAQRPEKNEVRREEIQLRSFWSGRGSAAKDFCETECMNLVMEARMDWSNCFF